MDNRITDAGDRVQMSMRFTYAQLVRMTELTNGYSKPDFEVWVDDSCVVHLDIYNLVYEVHTDGAYVARAKAAGRVIDTEGPLRRAR